MISRVKPKSPHPGMPRLRYSSLSATRPVLDRVSLDRGESLEVIGDGDNGCYEWLIRKDGLVVEHSDCGYGRSILALRDGLLVYFAERDPEELLHLVKQITAPQAETVAG